MFTSSFFNTPFCRSVGVGSTGAFVLVIIMANEQNLRPFDSDTAREAQAKSVEKRYENKIKKGLIASAILEVLSEDDLREIARGIIERSKENSNDLIAMRDTIGEKPKDTLTVENENIVVRLHHDD